MLKQTEAEGALGTRPSSPKQGAAHTAAHPALDLQAVPSPRCPELFQWDLQSRSCWQILDNPKHPCACSAPDGEWRHPLSTEGCSVQGCVVQDIFKRGQSNCRAFPSAPGRAAKALAVSTAARKVLLSKPVFVFQHPDIPAQFARVFSGTSTEDAKKSPWPLSFSKLSQKLKAGKPGEIQPLRQHFCA